MEAPDLLTPAARAKLAGARILLHQTHGFLYLPILAQTEVAAAAALAYLLADGAGTAPFHIAWPPLPDPYRGEPAANVWEAARKQLLDNLDHAIAVQAQGALLVLDASPSDRHRLARETVSYLNQRREALRRRQLRLVLLWPADAAQALMAGAPDLWSIRALAPVIEAADVEPVATERAHLTVEPAAAAAGGLSPAQQAQWQRWQAQRDLSVARLSVADAQALLAALYKQREWTAMSELAEGVLRHLERSPGADTLPQRANALFWLSLARTDQGNRPAALAPAQEAAKLYEQLAADNFAAYAPGLAGSLGNLSIRLAESGDQAGALAAGRRATDLYEQLAADNSAAYTPDLARSLNNLSVDLAESGDQAGALAAIRRATDLREQLAADHFAAYAPDLAGSLAILATRLAENGDRANALAALERAIALITPFALPGTRYADWLAAMHRQRERFD